MHSVCHIPKHIALHFSSIQYDSLASPHYYPHLPSIYRVYSLAAPNLKKIVADSTTPTIDPNHLMRQPLLLQEIKNA